MAEETAFGVSFGDPRRYMGKSPLGDVGQAIKTGLIGYGIQKSGLADWLNEKGMNKNKQGGYEYKPPGAAVPPTAAAPAPVAPTAPIAPVAPGTVPPAAMAEQPAMPTVELGPPPNVGLDVLDDKWEISEAAPVEKQDFNPLPSDMSNQMAMSPNAYQQTPGYGKLQKIASAIFGRG